MGMESKVMGRNMGGECGYEVIDRSVVKLVKRWRVGDVWGEEEEGGKE